MKTMNNGIEKDMILKEGEQIAATLDQTTLPLMPKGAQCAEEYHNPLVFFLQKVAEGVCWLINYRVASERAKMEREKTAKDTHPGTNAAPAEDACSEFNLGPFKWKIQGKDGTALVVGTVKNVAYLLLLTYIVFNQAEFKAALLRAPQADQHHHTVVHSAPGLTNAPPQL